MTKSVLNQRTKAIMDEQDSSPVVNKYENSAALFESLGIQTEGEESHSILEALIKSSEEYKQGKHCSVEILKERLNKSFIKEIK